MIQMNLGDSRDEADKIRAISKETIIKPFKNVVTIVSICSVFVLFSGLRIPAPAMSTMMSMITLPIWIIVIGHLF